MKLTGKPNVGNPHVGFDEAGTGNGLMSTAPVLDPTCGSRRRATVSGDPVPVTTVKTK